jgi:hypothetical protein
MLSGAAKRTDYKFNGVSHRLHLQAHHLHMGPAIFILRIIF